MNNIVEVVQYVQCLMALYILLCSLKICKHSQSSINIAISVLLILFIIFPPIGRKYISAASHFN